VTIEWTDRAWRELCALDKQVARRIVIGLERYAEIEHGDVKRLQDAESVLRLRVGDWRILCETLASGEILILRVLHRSQAYR
jgi:mRNA-degrading endonuclease RelE of RelBE toxin-antitoxin system